MPATTEITQPVLDLGKMSEVQKLAALLIILGPESAAQILKGLDEDKVHQVTGEMASLPSIGPRLQLDFII